MKDYFGIILICLFFIACQSDKKTEETPTVTTENKIEVVSPQEKIAKLNPKNQVTTDTMCFALVNKLNVRETPDEKAKILYQVAEGFAMVPTGKQSEHKTTITIRGQERTDTWKEVKLKNDKITGWVHGALIGNAKEDRFPSFNQEIEENIKAKKYKERAFGLIYNQAKDKRSIKELSFNENTKEWNLWDYNTEESYYVFLDGTKPVLIVTSPISESGDWYEHTEYFYNKQGKIRTYHYHHSSFNSNCGEARTDTWIYVDEDGTKSNAYEQETDFDGKIINGLGCFGQSNLDSIYKKLPEPSGLLESLELSPFFN